MDTDLSALAAKASAFELSHIVILEQTPLALSSLSGESRAFCLLKPPPVDLVFEALDGDGWARLFSLLHWYGGRSGRGLAQETLDQLHRHHFRSPLPSRLPLATLRRWVEPWLDPAGKLWLHLLSLPCENPPFVRDSWPDVTEQSLAGHPLSLLPAADGDPFEEAAEVEAWVECFPDRRSAQHRLAALVYRFLLLHFPQGIDSSLLPDAFRLKYGHSEGVQGDVEGVERMAADFSHILHFHRNSPLHYLIRPKFVPELSLDVEVLSRLGLEEQFEAEERLWRKATEAASNPAPEIGHREVDFRQCLGGGPAGPSLAEVLLGAPPLRGFPWAASGGLADGACQAPSQPPRRPPAQPFVASEYRKQKLSGASPESLVGQGQSLLEEGRRMLLAAAEEFPRGIRLADFPLRLRLARLRRGAEPLEAEEEERLMAFLRRQFPFRQGDGKRGDGIVVARDPLDPQDVVVNLPIGRKARSSRKKAALPSVQ